MDQKKRRAARPRRKICFVIEKLAERSGGAERVLIETANALAARGHEVSIVSHENRGRRPFYRPAFGVVHSNIYLPPGARGPLRQRLDQWRAAMHRAAGSYGFPMGRFPIAHLQWLSQHGGFWRRLEAHLDAHRPDVAIAFLPPAIVALGLVRPRHGLRRVASLHNVPEEDLLSRERWDANPVDVARRMTALARFDAICVLLPEFRDWFAEPLRGRVRVVPNSVEPIAKERIAAAARRKTVLSVGRLAPVKRQDVLIDAWARLAADFPDWKLKIYGVGPLEAALGARIAALGLAGKVRLMGHTGAITEQYLSASLLCHPARHEGWGLVVTEAMAAGLPAIGFADCPGVNRLIRDGENGVLAAADGDRAASLAVALAALMGDEDLRARLGAEAVRSAKAFSPAKVVDLWEDLVYETAVVRAGGT